MLSNFIKDFLLLNLKDYENIGIDFYINIFLLFAFLALGAAFFVIDYNRSCMSLTVKQLIRHGAENEENAKTLSELGLDNNKGVKALLRRESRLSKIVSRLGAKKYTYEEYVALEKKERKAEENINFKDARFYISEQQMKRAVNVYENYGSSVIRTVLYCVLLLSLYVCCVLVSPELLRLVDNFLGSLK